MTDDALLKVGDLARATGITVRTLHHYEQIGLLVAPHRTAAGHRLYGERDVQRLHRIRSLQQLGFSLDEIHGCLDRPEFSLRRVIEMHMARLDKELDIQRALRERLGAIASRLDSAEAVSVEDLMRTMEMMDKIEKYYTPEQLEKLRARRDVVGEERIQQVQKEWGKLIAQVRTEMSRGSAPEDPAVQALAKQWMGLVQEFTGGDPGITKSLGNVYHNETDMHERYDNVPDREMMEFIARACASRSE